MKAKKIISILTIALIVTFALAPAAFAIDTQLDVGVTGAQVGADRTGVSGTNIVTKGNQIIGLVQVVGIIIAVVMITVLGIKYMMGSAEEKAANKKSMLPYLIGAVCVLIGSSIVSIIMNLASHF